jgi:DNA polymerase-1
MEYRGVGINRAKFERQLGLQTRKLSDARNSYKEKTGKPAPDGPTETRAWLEEVLPADRNTHWPRTEKDKLLSVSEHAIDRLYDTLPEARDVIQIKRADKLLRSFGHKFIRKLNPVTQKFHCEFSIAGTKTGRFSCRQPNFQQLPGQKAGGDFREVVEAAPGRLLVGADYSQIEFRTLGEIAQDDAIRAIYLPGGSGDIHAEIAAEMNRITIEEAKGNKALRNSAKPIAFGAVYGMGGDKLAAYAHQSYGVEMTGAQGKEALDNFFDRFRGAWHYRRTNYNECEARGYILIPSGRIIHKDWEPEKNILFTLACNAPIQGAVGDLIMVCMRLVHRRLLRAGFDISEGLIACVHDELILEVLAEHAEQALQILRQAMIDAFAKMFPGASTNGLVNAAICKSWGEFK